MRKALTRPVATSITNPSEPSPSAGWHLSREAMLLVTALALIALFVFTGFMTRFYHQDERSLARQWSAKADAAMRAGDRKAAIEDYRTALIYSRGNGETSGANEIYELHLAEALAASNHFDEARAYFLTLAEREPGDATVNLELARLAARGGDVSEASRYYNSAIFGVWDRDPATQRRTARIEYSKFLLEHDQPAEAQAQLIALAAALPSVTRDDAALHVQAGNLLMESGATANALEEFQRALQLDRGSADAARGVDLALQRLGGSRSGNPQ